MLWGPIVDRQVVFVGQQGPLMVALFDTTEELRENNLTQQKDREKINLAREKVKAEITTRQYSPTWNLDLSNVFLITLSYKNKF